MLNRSWTLQTLIMFRRLNGYNIIVKFGLQYYIMGQKF